MAEAESRSWVKGDRVDRFVIRAPELIASAGEWERLAGGERLDGDAVGEVATTDGDLDERPDWAR
jgi:hypothetical protein